MSTDVKKHTNVAAGEVPARAALAAAILSVNDIIPVANATEAGQVATAVVAAGQVLASAPLTVRRADAPGMHSIEVTKDGTNWAPASSVLHFSTTGARDTWTTTNSALLTIGDKCWVGAAEYTWDGTAWQGDWVALTLLNSWVNFGGGYSPAQYKKLDGMVYVRGFIKSGTITAGTVYCTLPVGCRPLAHVISPGWGNSGPLSLEMLSGGNLVAGDSGGNATHTSFNFSFPAEQ